MTVPWWVWALTTVAASAGIGWAIVKAWTTHDWRTCMCVDCKKRRYHAHKRQGHVASGTTPDGDIIWAESPSYSSPYAEMGLKARRISTAQLEPRMVVVLNGQAYRVTEINTDIRGYLVGLQPTGGTNRRQPIIASIKWDNGNRKFWEVR